jgi:TetR/AcrR family transcriptional regulator of autoinduction and epiphytic fitness
VSALCRQRAQILEFLAPVARAAQLREPFSPQLRSNRARQYEIAKDELAELFAAELAAAGPVATELLHALTAATTWPAWSTLRYDLMLGVPAARQVMSRTVRALLSHANP